MELRIAGVLDSSETFAKTLDLNKVRKIDTRAKGVRVHLEASLAEVKKT